MTVPNRILIVDDCPEQAETLSRTVRELLGDGPEIVTAVSPLEAMGSLSKSPSDTVLCPVRMKTVTGAEFARFVMLAGIQTRLILLSGDGADEPVPEAGQYGISQVLDPSELSMESFATQSEKPEKGAADLVSDLVSELVLELNVDQSGPEVDNRPAAIPLPVPGTSAA